MTLPQGSHTPPARRVTLPQLYCRDSGTQAESIVGGLGKNLGKGWSNRILVGNADYR